MSYARMLRDAVDLFRAARGLTPDGDETVEYRPLARGVPGYFDTWEERLDTPAERLDSRRHARLFLCPDAPAVAAGDRVEHGADAWSVEQVRAIVGRAKDVRVLELVWLEERDAGTGEDEPETGDADSETPW